MLELSQHLLLPILFLTGLLAGTVDAIAGGGGLISLPMLLGVGLPPHLALGTNKLQSSIGTFVATWRYHRQGWLSIRTAYQGLVFGFIGAVLGSIAGQALNGDILKKIIPILLLCILLYTIFAPKLWSEEHKPKMKELSFYALFGLVLGFYDAFLGPGTGSFWLFALVYFLGFSITKATAYTKILNLNSNVVTLLCFAIGHNVDYRIGLCMAAGQLIGGYLGANLAITQGAKFIRPVFIVMVSATILSLIYKNYLYHASLNIKILFVFSIVTVIALTYFGYNRFAAKSINKSQRSQPVI